MKRANGAVAALPDHAVSGDSAAMLGAILLPSITLAVWHRASASSLLRWIDALDLAAIDDVRFTASSATLSDCLAAALGQAGYGRSPGATLLRHDIEALAHRFLDIIDQPLIEIRLEVVETDACRKFHADFVAARLITTYRGPGTEWLDRASAHAHVAGTPAASLAIRRMDAGDVALLKGRLWAPEDALIHRSPQITGSGIRRLVLVLNPGGDEPPD